MLPRLLSIQTLAVTSLLAVVLAGTAPASAMTLIASQVLYGPQDIAIDISIDTNTDLVDMTITGPEGVWFGVGFDSTVDANTYTIIAAGDASVHERKLGDHNSGTLLTAMVNVSSNTDDGTVRTVVLQRDRVGITADHYTFPDAEIVVDLIWAYGSSSSFGFHANRGTLPITFVAVPNITPGDGNGDGWIDGIDYLLWASNFGTHPGADGDISDGDYNDDGWIDGIDYLLWAGNFGTHTESAAVPEPSALAATLLALTGLLTISTRRRE